MEPQSSNKHATNLRVVIYGERDSVEAVVSAVSLRAED